MVQQELRLANEVDAVPRARRFVTSALKDLLDPATLSDAELAVSELVTNGLLHADTEMTLRLTSANHSVRIEVEDELKAGPIRPIASVNSMTGRGLALVEQIVKNMGVTRTATGKIVWCELSTVTARPAQGRERLSAIPEQGWSGSGFDDSETLYTVTLGDVPTELLLAAKEHMDNLDREFTLAATGAASGESSQIPTDMAQMVETVIHRFALPRQAIKVQALAAAAKGEPRTELTLRLPLSAAKAGEAYLAALDQADAYARSARILTLETPPQHRVFRRWYVGSLAEQLRVAAAGGQVPPQLSFEQRLLAELDTAAMAQTAAEDLASRLEHLQQLTSELTSVSRTEDIAEVVVGHAADAFGAVFAAVYLLDGESLQALRTRGEMYGESGIWAALPLDAPLPLCEAVREKTAVIARGKEELARRWPSLVVHDLQDRSVACVPLIVGDRRLGAIALTFPIHRDLNDTDEISFLSSLADACAQALDRANALTEARETADKLAFLADASAQLATSLDFRATMTMVADMIVPRLADWCAVQTIDEQNVDNIAISHIDPSKVAYAEELQRRYPTDLESPTGLPQVVRTGRAELYPVITDEMLVAGARDEEHLRISRQLKLTSAMVVPLTGSEGTFGAITLVYAESGRRYTEEDLVLATELARRAALAVEHARKFDVQTGKLATITRIAEAAQHAILAPVPPRVGPVVLAGSYLSAAREALVGGDLYEVVPTDEGVRLLIGDVRGKGLDAVRLATVVLGFFRTAAVEAESLAEVARQLDSRLLPYLDEEDFVTALMLHISPDGSSELVSCGHPLPLLAHGGKLIQVNATPSPPLGLGANPEPSRLDLTIGDRLLLYTDGLIEARSADGRYADLMDVAQPLGQGNLGVVLQRIMARLRTATGGDLNDDLALLAAEYSPPSATRL